MSQYRHRLSMRQVVIDWLVAYLVPTWAYRQYARRKFNPTGRKQPHA